MTEALHAYLGRTSLCMPFAATIKIGDKACRFAGSDVATIFSPSVSDINKWANVGRPYLFKSKWGKVPSDTAQVCKNGLQVLGRTGLIGLSFPKGTRTIPRSWMCRRYKC